jgi:hypothetical protein
MDSAERDLVSEIGQMMQSGPRDDQVDRIFPVLISQKTGFDEPDVRRVPVEFPAGPIEHRLRNVHRVHGLEYAGCGTDVAPVPQPRSSRVIVSGFRISEKRSKCLNSSRSIRNLP